MEPVAGPGLRVPVLPGAGIVLLGQFATVSAYRFGGVWSVQAAASRYSWRARRRGGCAPDRQGHLRRGAQALRGPSLQAHTQRRNHYRAPLDCTRHQCIWIGPNSLGAPAPTRYR